MADVGPAQTVQKTVSHVLGEVCWLMTQSPVHKQMFIGDLEWFAMPAILMEQFRIFNGPQHPMAVAFWANVSVDTDERLKAGASKLRADEWNSGAIPWLIELIAPFGGEDEILSDISKEVFKSQPFSFHTLEPGSGRVVRRFAVS